MSRVGAAAVRVVPPDAEPDAARDPRSALGSRLGLWLGFGICLGLLTPGAARVPALLLYNLLLGLLFAYDRAQLRRASLKLERQLPAQLRPGVATPYVLRLALSAGPRLRLLIEEQGQAFLRVAPGLHHLQLARGAEAQVNGELVMERHGRSDWPSLWVRRESTLGLCAVITQHTRKDMLRGYPQLPARQSGLRQLAPRRRGAAPAALRVVEQGGEIERLREYVSTDSMRSLDWKASAKRGRPITRSYQPERNQTLWIVLDASRAMTLPAELVSTPAVKHVGAKIEARGPDAARVRSRFDAALEAALALSDTALREGDRVGLLVFAREPKLCVTPRAGHAQWLKLLEHSLELHAEPSELDTQALLASIGRCAPKRSLVVLFTDLDNEGDLRELARHARLLARRHMSLCVSLRPVGLSAQVSAPVERERDVYHKLAAISLEEQRSQLARALQNAGLELVESPLPQLAERIVQRYHAAKISGRL